jgi:hypothetical protein
MPICGFCEKEVDRLHQRSHILPDWMCKSAIKPEGLKVTSGKVQVTQRATWAAIVCAECETLFSIFDTYAANLWGENNAEWLEKQRIVSQRWKWDEGVDLFFFTLDGVKAKCVKDFVLSVAVRGNLHRKRQSLPPLMNDSQQKSMREQILGDSFNRDEFAVQLFATDRLCVAIGPTLLAEDQTIRFMGKGLFYILHIEAASQPAPEFLVNPGRNFIIEVGHLSIGLTQDAAKLISNLPDKAKEYATKKVEEMRKRDGR